MLSNDSDGGDGGPLTVLDFSQPANGTVTRDSGCSQGGLRFIPDDLGVDYSAVFTYIITDTADEDETSVSVTIEY